MEIIEDKFSDYGDIGARNWAILNLHKMNILLVQENIPEFEKVVKDTFELAIDCYFDAQIETIFVDILQYVKIPKDNLNLLLDVIRDNRICISKELSKVLVLHFNMWKTLLSEGKKFFEEIKDKEFVEFVSNLENRDYQRIRAFLEKDINFAIMIANSFKDFPELRRQIIDSLPNDKNIQKEKLFLLLNYDEGELDEAFDILKQLDLSELTYFECIPILQLIQKKRAWDFAVIVIEKLLAVEKDHKKRFDLQISLFIAYRELKNHYEIVKLGEKILTEDAEQNNLDSKDKESLLGDTILACLERGKTDNEGYRKARELLLKFGLEKPSFGFRVSIEADVYIKNGEASKALQSVIDGVKEKKVLSSEEYARLYFLLSIEIGRRIHLSLDSLQIVKENVFVKFVNSDKWFFIGDSNELDASKIGKSNKIYSLLFGKRVGDKISLGNKYRVNKSEEVIEEICDIEGYIFRQVIRNFQKLSREGILDGVQSIDVPQFDDEIDLKYLSQFFEDEKKRTTPFFEMYCQNTLPFAMLVRSEGGFENALGRIQNDNKGFINFGSGFEELEKQERLAKEIIDGRLTFYIDGTSAMLLAGFGELEKILDHIPNLKIPQSVINFLANFAERF